MPAGHGPWWGYHRLDSRWAERLVASADVSPGDIVLDIGAGTGALTLALLEAGARVIAVELHDERVRMLRQRFEGERVVVVRADASDLRLPREPFRVVANPPFGITTSLLRRLVAPGSRLIRADVVVPLHVAERWAAPGAPGAGRWRSQFHITFGPQLPRRAFIPPATTHTVVLRIEACRAPSRSVRTPTSGRRRRHVRPRPRAPSSKGLETLAGSADREGADPNELERSRRLRRETAPETTMLR